VIGHLDHSLNLITEADRDPYHHSPQTSTTHRDKPASRHRQWSWWASLRVRCLSPDVADLPGRVDLNPGQLQESFPRRVQIATSFHCTPDKASLLQIIDPRPTRKGVSATCRVSNCACRSTNSCTWPVDWAQDYFVCRPGSKGHPQIRQHVSSVCYQSD